MIILFHNFSSNSPWGVAIAVGLFLLTVAPTLMSNHATLLPSFMGRGPRGQQRDQGEEASFLGRVSEFLDGLLSFLLVAGLLGLAAFTFLRQVWQTGLAGAFDFGPAQAAPRSGSNTQRRRRTQQRRPNWRRDGVDAAIRALPLQPYYSRSELAAMPVQELKAKAREMQVDLAGAFEKQDLVNRLSELGGSSGGSCSVCFEDYECGDMLRVMPCGHRFHVECVDKWLITSTSLSRGPACPNCNAPLVPEE